MKELPLTAKYLPSFDVRDFHQRTVPADPAVAYAALRRLDFSRSRLVRVIFGVRTLPSLLRGEEWGAPRGPFLEQALELGWRILEEVPGRELAAGAVTQPWQPVVSFRGLPADELLVFDEPGFVVIVWGIAAWPAVPGSVPAEPGSVLAEPSSVVATETRVRATDAASRARFRRYWLVLGVGIRLIRRLALADIHRELSRARADASGR
jgi:hypothetical protein